MQKSIKSKVRRPKLEPEPTDFVQKIRMGTTTEEEEAEEEEPTETLERHAPKRSQEQRAKVPAPPVVGTQQQAKEQTPIAVGLEEWVEPRAAQNEAALDQTLLDFGQEQVLLDFDREQVFPNLGSEQGLTPEASTRQPEKRQEQQPEPLSGSAQSTPTKGGEHGPEKSTCQQWLRWLSEQVSGVADQLDVEERCREHLTRTTTKELVSLWTQIQSMQGELTRAKDYDRLYREHKQAESDHKKRGVEFDRQLEKVKEQLKEIWLDLAKTMDELDKKKEALSTEKTQVVEWARQLEEAAKEKIVLTKKRNEEAERATYVLNKLQDTY